MLGLFCKRRPTRRDRTTVRPAMEVLEDRLVPALLTVTTLQDTGAMGDGSLRGEIAAAAPGDTINFAVTGTITLISGELAIGKDLTIDGPGANNLTVSAGGGVRGFFISGANVTLDGLTISDAAFGPLQNGGGIQFVGGGTLTVSNCAVTNNFANSAGGIDNIGGTVNVVNTTLSGNKAGGGGVAGAIWNDGGTLNVTNSTISGNISNTNEAGGIWNNNGGTTTLLNTTITDNQSSLVGGGVWNQFGTVNVENTIIAGNTSTGTTSDDVQGAFTSQGNNLIGDTDGATGFGGSDLTGTGLTPLDPKLGPLADYGGPTQTMALLAGSPAIDAGDNSGVPANDQRGFARVANGTVDIGAFEAQPVTFTVTNTNDSGPGSLRQYVQDNNLLGGGNTITFAIPTSDPGFNPATGQFTITLIGGEIDITQNVTLIGPGAGVMAVSGNAAGRIFGTNANVSISGLTLADGQSVGVGGGAINDTGGSLILTDCVLSNNGVIGNNGGAIESVNSSLTITNCAFSGNSADGNGGAIDSPGVTLAVSGSTFDHNTTNVGGGGALSIGTGTVNLTNSTFTANSAASGVGGAINSNFAADFTVLTCTIAGNIASVGGGVINTGFGTFTLTNSIVANDSAAVGGNDVAGVIASGGNCLVKDTSPGSGSFTPGPDDLAPGTDPMLGPLADNGGPTKTMAVLHGSPAIDAGNASSAPLTDQRGLPRFGNTDIGALEYQFKVTNTSDSGPGSLRQAIINANGTALHRGNPNVIQFDIPGGGVQTITPLTQLPAITNPVVIDGYSQASSSPNTLSVGDNVVLVVRLDGSSAGPGINGLVLDVNNSTVQGLSITGFRAGLSGGGFGIFVQGSNDIIRGNFIGLLPDGTTAAGNGGDGIRIVASNNVVGGTAPADRNLISDNLANGVEISGSGTTGNAVEGNYIGLSAAGTAALGNAGNGVGIDSGASNNTIGFTIAGAGNVISGNFANGVEINGSGTTGNVVAGNFIGADSSGAVGVGNDQAGVSIDSGASNNTVGGTATGAGNVISGNSGDGVQLSGSGTTGNTVLGNDIGTDVNGAPVLGNGHDGVLLWQGATGNTVGGSGAAANLIAGNSADAVEINETMALATGNLVQGLSRPTDTLTYLAQSGGVTTSIDFSAGAVSGLGVSNAFAGLSAITLDADGGTADIRGGSFANEVETPSAADAGSVVFDGSFTINYQSATQVQDTVPLTGTAIYNGTASPEAIDVLDGGTVDGFQSTQLNSGGSGTFAPLLFANKQAVVVNGVDGADAFTVNNPHPDTGLSRLSVQAGPASSTFNILTAAPGVSAAAVGGAGNDSFNVTVALAAGAVLTVDGGAGKNALEFDAQAHHAVGTVPGALTVDPASQRVSYTNVTALSLNNALAVDAFYGPNTANRGTALPGLTAAERFVQVLYLDALGRAGSKAELDGWAAAFGGSSTSNAQIQAAIARGIEGSPEGRDHEVKSWYLQYLGRAATGGEEMGWVTMLRAGQTEESVLSQILGSAEFFNHAQTLGFSGSANSQYVQALYEFLVHRAGSAVEVADWVGALPAAGCQRAALGFLESRESRTGLFEGYYNALLHRPADSAGLNGWVAAGLDVFTTRIDVESSAEFFSNS